MGLFKADLYRALAVGFLLGSLAVFASVGGVSSAVAPQAIAATH